MKQLEEDQEFFQKPQEQLLAKLLNLEDTMWKSDYEHDQHLFYKYFFDWGKDVQKTRKTTKSIDDGESNEGMSQMNEAETKAETKKLAMFKMSQEM